MEEGIDGAMVGTIAGTGELRLLHRLVDGSAIGMSEIVLGVEAEGLPPLGVIGTTMVDVELMAALKSLPLSLGSLASYPLLRALTVSLPFTHLCALLIAL